MGSEDVGELTLFGGQPAYEEHASESAGSAHDALRALMPDDDMRALFDASRALAGGLTRFFANEFVERVDDVVEFALFLGGGTLPFRFAPVEPEDPSQDFGGRLQYYPETLWKGLSAEAVVTLLAFELGLEADEVGLNERSPWAALPSQGVLRIPPRFFGGRAPFGILKLALLKLSKAYGNEVTRAQLIAWADELAGH